MWHSVLRRYLERWGIWVGWGSEGKLCTRLLISSKSCEFQVGVIVGGGGGLLQDWISAIG